MSIVTQFKNIIIFLIVLFGFLSTVVVVSNEGLEQQILSQMAVQNGISEAGLQITDVNRKNYPLTGVTVLKVKLVDNETGERYSTVVDGNGNKLDYDQVTAEENAAYRERYGSLTQPLYEQLQSMGDDETLTVSIWLKDSRALPEATRPAFHHTPSEVEQGDAPLPLPYTGKKSASNEEASEVDQKTQLQASLAERVQQLRDQQVEKRALLDQAKSQNTASISRHVSGLQQPVIDYLYINGFQPSYVSTTSPVIYAELPKWAIIALSKRLDIDAIYGPNENFDLMNTAKPTQKADIVDNLFGFDGTGIDLAILEDSRIEFLNPNLNAGTTRVPADPNVDQHATATAGMVASQDATQQGISQGVNLFSANGTTYDDANMSAAMDWAAITQNVDIINNSWGGNAGVTTLNEHDRHLDYIVRNHWSTVTVAAGNEKNGCGSGTARVTSPARGYNVISVGNYADQDTLTWVGDAMGVCSSDVDPSTGMEKPEVAASGSSITSTLDVSPWIGAVGSGTSYAAPMVAGEAALLMERNASLEIRPEAVKAIIMASAVHNIEGSSRLSESDGAGGVDMRAAFRIVDESWWTWDAVSATSFPYSRNVFAYAGEVVRAVISWDSNPNAAYTSDPLEADIDLLVYDPDGLFVTSSAVGGRSYEIVEFTATKTGNYELRVDDWSFLGTTEYVGFAWWPGHRVLSNYAPQSMGTPPIARDYYRFTANSLWNVVGIRQPAASNYNIYLYDSSAFDDPDDYDRLEDSTLSSVIVDFVVVDRNHAPAGDYFVEVNAVTGTGNYAIELGSHSADTDGSFGPYTMATSQVVRVWDSYLTSGVRKYFAIKPTSGDADLGMALMDSDPANTASFYQGRSQRIVEADIAGAGAEETMNYQTATSDWMGLVVFNNGATTSTPFYLYTDTSAPTGSITIDGGAAVTNSQNVILTLSATDAQTGVDKMRFSNDGVSWSAWETYGTTKSWTLSAGDGVKTVYVQYMNNAAQPSASISDTITLELDITPPLPDPMTWATEPFEVSTSSIGMTATMATDLHGPVQYYFWADSLTGGGGNTHSGLITSTSYTDTGLGINHQYRFWVRAQDSATIPNTTDWSANSDEYTAIEASTGVTFGTKTSTSLDVRSTNTPSGLTRGSSGLIVYNDTAGVNSGWKLDNNYWTSSPLVPNTQYCFRAQSRNGDATATAASSSSCMYTLANLPDITSFSAITQTSIQVNWKANSNPTGTQYLVENTTNGSNSGWTTALNWNNTGLDCGTPYSYRMKVRNGDLVETTWLNLGSATTLACPDTDGDGIPDYRDNCTQIINPSQHDTDSDGYGNMCDGDLNNTGFVDFPDLTLFQTAFFTTDANADFNGSGFVDFPDLTLFQGMFFKTPGPSCCGIPLP